MNDYLKSLAEADQKAKVANVRDLDKSILKVYKDAGTSMASKFRASKEGSATRAFYADYIRSLNVATTELIKKHGFKTSFQSAETQSLIMSKMFKEAGMTIDFSAHYGKIPYNTLKTFMGGEIYKDGLGLSPRIWGTAIKAGDNIQHVVAVCKAQQMSSIKMAKILEEYVDPDVRKTWTPKHQKEIFGPGYQARAGNVEYNALRMARTTVAHMATLAQKEASLSNPYATGLKWHLSPSHDFRMRGKRDICDEHANDDKYGLGPGVFPIKDCPFDHPNGLCHQSTYFDKSLDEIGTELKKWIQGEPVKVMDDWAKNFPGMFDLVKAKLPVAVSKEIEKRAKIKPTETTIPEVVDKAVDLEENRRLIASMDLTKSYSSSTYKVRLNTLISETPTSTLKAMADDGIKIAEEGKKILKGAVIDDKVVYATAKEIPAKFKEMSLKYVVKETKEEVVEKVITTKIVEKVVKEVPVDLKEEYAFLYKKLDRFVSVDKNALKYADDMAKMIDDSPAFIKQILKEQGDELSFDSITSKDTFYSMLNKDITCNLAKEAKSKATGLYSSFFHEYGHLIDRKTTGGFKRVSASYQFNKSMYKDMEDMIEKLGLTGKSPTVISKKISTLLKAEGDLGNGVSDIYSGLTMNKTKGLWSHDATYWKHKAGTDLKADPEALNGEAFAWFFSAYTNPERLAIMQKWFPSASNEFEAMVKKYIKSTDYNKVTKAVKEVVEEIIEEVKLTDEILFAKAESLVTPVFRKNMEKIFDEAKLGENPYNAIIKQVEDMKAYWLKKGVAEEVSKADELLKDVTTLAKEWQPSKADLFAIKKAKEEALAEAKRIDDLVEKISKLPEVTIDGDVPGMISPYGPLKTESIGYKKLKSDFGKPMETLSEKDFSDVLGWADDSRETALKIVKEYIDGGNKDYPKFWVDKNGNIDTFLLSSMKKGDSGAYRIGDIISKNYDEKAIVQALREMADTSVKDGKILYIELTDPKVIKILDKLGFDAESIGDGQYLLDQKTLKIFAEHGTLDISTLKKEITGLIESPLQWTETRTQTLINNLVNKHGLDNVKGDITDMKISALETKSKVLTSQELIDKLKYDKTPFDSDEMAGLVKVIKYDGKYVISEGDDYVALAYLQGTKNIKVQLIDIDDMIVTGKIVNTTPTAKTLANFTDHVEQFISANAKKFGSKAKVDQALDVIKKMAETSVTRSRIEQSVLKKVLDSKFMTQFETGTSNGSFNPSFRKQATEMMFGSDTKIIPNDEFEFYGYLWQDDFLHDMEFCGAGQYGQTIVQFKDSIRQRTTFTIDDSLGPCTNGRMIPALLDDPTPNWRVSSSTTDEIARSSPTANSVCANSGARYVEAQYHGGVYPEDIEQVIITWSKGSYDSNSRAVDMDLVAKCKSLGIKVGSVDRSKSPAKIVWY